MIDEQVRSEYVNKVISKIDKKKDDPSNFIVNKDPDSVLIMKIGGIENGDKS